MKTLLTLLFFIHHSAWADSKSCLNALEVQEVLDSTTESLAPFLLSLDTKVSISYTPNEGPLMAYAWAKDPKATEIRIQGSNCHSLFFRDEIQMLLCHEIGHLAGGDPFMNFHGSSAKISAEGQSDFFAASSCLPFLWKPERKQGLQIQSPRSEAIEYCKAKVNPLCQRIASAALNFQEYQHLLAEKEGGSRIPPLHPGPKPRLASWDPKKVRKTLLREYPSAQCRLDIMKVGIDCEASNLPANFHRFPLQPLICAENMETVPLPACYRAKPDGP